MYVSIALVVILLLRMAYAFYAQKCCFEAWDHKLHWLPPHPANPHPAKVWRKNLGTLTLRERREAWIHKLDWSSSHQLATNGSSARFCPGIGQDVRGIIPLSLQMACRGTSLIRNSPPP